MKINILTIFDKNFIVKSMAFYDAMAKLGTYNFWFFCLDQETEKVMTDFNLPNVRLISLESIDDPELLETRKNRNAAEFVFTAKAAGVDYVARRLPLGDALIFSDNDVIFFLPPDKLIDRMRQNNQSIAISPHKFPVKNDHMNARVGRYNAGLIFFIIDENSRACTRDWRKECIEWCYLIDEKDRFADQKYINRWPKRYTGVYEIRDKGVNVANWNISNWKISRRGEQFFVDDEPLICYHFHRVRFYISGEKVRLVPIYIFHRELYKIYDKMIETAWKKLISRYGKWEKGFVEKPHTLRLWKQKLYIRYVRRID